MEGEEKKKKMLVDRDSRSTKNGDSRDVHHHPTEMDGRQESNLNSYSKPVARSKKYNALERAAEKARKARDAGPDHQEQVRRATERAKRNAKQKRTKDKKLHYKVTKTGQPLMKSRLDALLAKL